MSAVFYANDAQRDAIERTRDRFVDRPDQVRTEIAPLDRFWIAEDYHQKYRLRHDGQLFDELRGYYPEDRDLVDSTAAARINGFLDGFATEAQLARDLDHLGLSDDAKARLARLAR